MKTINRNEIETGGFYIVLEAMSLRGFINEIIQVERIEEPFMLIRCKTGVCGIMDRGDRKPNLVKIDDFVLAQPSKEFITAALPNEEWSDVIL